MSRESQLRHLAAWFTAVGSQDAAHALFDSVFGLGAPRHVSVTHPDPEAIPTRHSWWEAPAVELSRTLVEAGRAPGQGNGRPARVDRCDDRRAELRRQRLAEERRFAEAGAALSDMDIGSGIPLDRPQAAVLLRLLEIALGARVAAARRIPLVAAAYGLRLTLMPVPGAFTTVPTVDGALHLDGYALTVTVAENTMVRELVLA